MLYHLYSFPPNVDHHQCQSTPPPQMEPWFHAHAGHRLTASSSYFLYFVTLYFCNACRLYFLYFVALYFCSACRLYFLFFVTLCSCNACRLYFPYFVSCLSLLLLSCHARSICFAFQSKNLIMQRDHILL